VRDTCTAENFIICRIASLVFMEGSKLDICNIGQKVYTIHRRVKISTFLLNALGFFYFFQTEMPVIEEIPVLNPPVEE